MDEKKLLAERFETHRGHLRAVAYRILGSLSEAEDAVQETWLKAERADTDKVENLAGWLTTVIGRVCLDMLRSKKSRREDSLDDKPAEHTVVLHTRVDPEEEALLADSVGLALLVVLDTLSPVERLAFVLHDMFSVPFAEIAAVVERSPETTQRLASRARQRVRGKSVAGDADKARQHKAVEAFLHAARQGEFEALLTMLDPDAVFHADAMAQRLASGTKPLTGARAIAEQFNGQAGLARTILLDGEVGVLVAPRGKILLVMKVRFDGDRIVELEAVADEKRLAELELSLP